MVQYFWTKLFFNPNFPLLKICFYFNFFMKNFLDPNHSGPKFLDQIFLDSNFFWIKNSIGPKKIFIHKWTQHFLHPNILFKLMTIWLNLNLQSNCLSLDWAPAQLQLVHFVDIHNWLKTRFILIMPNLSKLVFVLFFTFGLE